MADLTKADLEEAFENALRRAGGGSGGGSSNGSANSSATIKGYFGVGGFKNMLQALLNRN